MKHCILCGGALPPTPWWKRILGGGPPTHNAKGPDGPECWRGFNRRMGLDPNRPMPRATR